MLSYFWAVALLSVARCPLAIVLSGALQNTETDTSPTTQANTTTSPARDTRFLVMAYYAGWAADKFPPEQIDFTRFDWIDFAFAVPNQHFDLTWDNPEVAPGILSRLVCAAHSQAKKVKLSVGGWTGSKYFSSAVATPENRQRFAQNIATTYRNFDLDGIDIDWEYPGKPGDMGNQVNPEDAQKFLLFLQLLRGLLACEAKLSAAAVSAPFIGPDGHPLTDMTEFAQVLDWVLIMNYDVWGSSQDPGPNAPLSDGCANSSQPDASAEAGYKSWTNSGFPPDKLVLGVPAYGYISKSSASQLRTRRSETQQRYSQRKSVVKLINGDDDSEGQILFRELVEQGALCRIIDPFTGEVSFGGAGGFERRWDECSATPYLRSTQAKQVVTYDDTISIRDKAEFAKNAQMLGINFFDIHGDTENWDLTDAVRKVLWN